jgi:hypothetical protein
VQSTLKVPSDPLKLHKSSKLVKCFVQLIPTPITTKMAIKGMFDNLYLRRNMRKMHPAVIPKVRTLKVEKVSLMISKGFVNGV